MKSLLLLGAASALCAATDKDAGGGSSAPPALTSADVAGAVEAALKPVRKALGIHKDATTKEITAQIARLRNQGGEYNDPAFAEMVKEKMDAGLSKEDAESCTRRQFRHDARVAAEEADRVKREAAAAKDAKK